MLPGHPPHVGSQCFHGGLGAPRDQQFLAAADLMQRHISGARKVTLAGAGHAANLDAPEEFNAELGRFLMDLTGRR